MKAFEDGQQKKLRAGHRPLTSDKSPITLTRGRLYKRRNPGLGLPGSGWFNRERSNLREGEQQRV